jgi:hypothetical protein
MTWSIPNPCDTNQLCNSRYNTPRYIDHYKQIQMYHQSKKCQTKKEKGEKSYINK